jgi:class 3 adenylate cyclase
MSNPRAQTSENNPQRGAPPAGERRVITALFCDVVNSTTLAEQLDPEDWAEIMNDAFQRASAPVLRYGGTVNKLMGDGFLALFGVPVGHEDDPQRAILAGLDILAAIKAFGAEVKQSRGLDFAMRVGINTGPVVVADVGSPQATDHTALGDAVNVAARMEQTAAPGTLQISAETYRLVAPLFDVVALGDIELKGKRERAPAYRVTGAKAHPGRLRGIDGVSAPLIGRDAEFAILKQRIAELRQGRGGIVTLVGEAGLGKSRLLSELEQHWNAIADPEYWDVLTGIPYDSSRPYGLFQNMARAIFGIDLNDTAEEIRAKVRAYLVGTGASEYQIGMCSVAFVNVIAAKVLQDVPDYPADVIRQDIFDNLTPGVRDRAAGSPMVLVVDDLHWSDQPSADLILHLIQLVEEVPVLFILSFRPERQSPAWKIKTAVETDYPHRLTEIVLKPLAAGDTDDLVSALLKIADLPPELRRLILRKAEGNPYFVEEIVRTLIDDGAVYQTDDGLRWKAATNVADIDIPDNLQALLMARIDRLDQQAKATLQLASVIGRSFYYRILKAISDQAMALDKQIVSLERVELLREAGRVPELQYMFKHELARDAAYASILNRRRREFHQRVGEAIESLFPDHLGEQAHRLAQHFRLAGDHVKALKYYEMAGDAAAGVHARAEGAGAFTEALDAARALHAGSDVIAGLERKRAALG